MDAQKIDSGIAKGEALAIVTGEKIENNITIEEANDINTELAIYLLLSDIQSKIEKSLSLKQQSRIWGKIFFLFEQLKIQEEVEQIINSSEEGDSGFPENSLEIIEKLQLFISEHPSKIDIAILKSIMGDSSEKIGAFMVQAFSRNLKIQS